MRPIATTIFAVDDLAAPAWASELLSAAPAQADQRDGVELAVQSTAGASLITARIRKAVDLNAADFEQKTVQAYSLIRQALAQLPAAEPVRFWNHLPIIHQPMDTGRDRYMVFNAGRFRAFTDWFGGPDEWAAHVATASGVGHRGADFVIHCLAATQRGHAVENPRQIPSFRYSKRYGPLPPCFARATIVENLLPAGPVVLVGGTASICGERTVHEDELDAQFGETLANLSSLVTAAGVSADPLKAFSTVRIYYPRADDAAAIEAAAIAAFTAAEQLQLIQADLCRSELRVEIEGIAQL